MSFSVTSPSNKLSTSANQPVQSGCSQKPDTCWAATPWGMFLACLVACLLWGSAFPSIKIGYELYGIANTQTAHIMLFAGIRFVLAGLMVVLAMSIAKRKPFVPAKTDWKSICKLSVFQTVGQYILFYIGLAHATGVTSSILEGSNTLFAVLMSALLFRFERLNGQKLAGCLVGFAGVILIATAGTAGGQHFNFMGEGFILLSTLCAAFSSNLAKHFSQTHDPVLLSAWQFIVGGAVISIVGLALGGRVLPPDTNTASAILILLYLAFISAAAYSAWSIALAHNPVSKVAVFGFMNPVAGVILSKLFLTEATALNPARTLLALALVSLGIIIVNYQKVRPEKLQQST